MSKKNNRGKFVPGNATSRTTSNRTPVAPKQDSIYDKKPSWKFRRFDSACELWGMNTLNDNLQIVMDGLKSYEDLTWQQIMSATHDKKGKSKNHDVELSDLTNTARRRLNKIKADDIQSVFSLRLNNLFRIIGILEGAILNILWIDPKHEVCETKR